MRNKLNFTICSTRLVMLIHYIALLQNIFFELDSFDDIRNENVPSIKRSKILLHDYHGYTLYSHIDS